jgi:ubiquinone/menaquinone biosynthesis C-methylase UbiE
MDKCRYIKNKQTDVIGNVENLPFKNSYFNIVKAKELFEHVDNYEKGISECLRVLKKGGYFIFSIPFIAPIHNEPNDYQRLTEKK